MADLVLLKMLHDAFYSGDFSNNAIQQMIKSTRFTSHQNQMIREAAANIDEKITHLQSGSAAPAICLNNLTGQKTCTNQTTGKYKYIIFADTEMAVSREHLKYLSAIEEKYAKNLEIFIVLRNTDAAQMKKFFAESEVPGVKLVDGNSEYISLYKVKSFPQCYLLDQNHKVKITSVKAPLDGFEQQFGALLQNERIENMRKQGK
jgi:Icc-related predicted phosphoesterase